MGSISPGENCALIQNQAVIMTLSRMGDYINHISQAREAKDGDLSGTKSIDEATSISASSALI